MSWLFGIIKSGKNNCSKDNYDKIYPNALLTVSTHHLSLALGGISETCLYEVQNDSQESGWAVLGLGIKVTSSDARILDKGDWGKIISSGAIPIETLDGHFVAVRWKKEEIEIFTDQLGLRTAYYAPCDAGICFSTRLDWVAQKSKLHELNCASIGGRWLLFNQVSYDSCVKGIERVGPSSHVVFKNGVVQRHKCHSWTATYGDQIDGEATSILESLICAAAKNGRMVSLGLSGGIDSRTVLALLMAKRTIHFDVQTFGGLSDPDVRISDGIARKFQLRRHYFDDPIPATEELIPLLRSFVAQNLLVEPISSILRLRYYSRQYDNGQLLIDGGLGEIARRQYLNRMVRFGRKALQTNDIRKIFELLRTPRADIFNHEFSKELESAACLNLESTLQSMPPVNEIGVENFVDLLSVRMRVPNYAEPEQTRSDAFIMNFMPFVQPSFLKAIFKMDLKRRRNGRFFKDLIQAKESRLKKFPLVKSGTTYPFGLSTPAAWLVTKVKNKISTPYIDPMPDQFLVQLKDFVLDIAHSTEVRNWPGYNQNIIRNSIDAYYQGERNFQRTVIWWLTFELWRRSLYAP